MRDRRGFLSGLVSLPLIGGGVTLIGAPAAPVPLARAAALPGLGDPRQRARYAWAAFSAAMADLTAGADGWRILAADVRRVELPWGSQDPCAFLRTVAVDHDLDLDCRMLVERQREIAL